MPLSSARPDPNAARVLVTGATGFVGGHALAALSARDGAIPVAGCRDRTRLAPTFTGEVREGDLRDPAYRARALAGIDVLVLSAAWTSAWGHKAQSAAYHRDMTVAVIDDALAAGVRRIVHVSSTIAAAPGASADPMSPGVKRGHWPHLDNVIDIENHLRAHADKAVMVNLRFGFFAGARYGLGLVPLLVPRLGTHLVPWVDGGRTHLPIVDGSDIGLACALAATAGGLSGYEGFNVVGPEVPTAREVIEFLHHAYGVPKPHFGVTFPMAYAFARLMELIDPLVPWEPLVTRSMIQMLEEPGADNARAEARLGYRPRVRWQEALATTMEEMRARGGPAMAMARPLPTQPA